MNRCRFVVLFIVVGLSAATLPLIHADDSAAAIAVGGLVPRRETRIVMAKEVLKISPKKVVVDYDFRNDSDEDVTTEVAFPIPPYVDGPNERSASLESFSDFKLLINGVPTHYSIEAKAFLKKKDVTRILEADHIDIPSFGHNDWKKGILDLNRLSKSEQSRLVHLGLFDLDAPMANWTVHLQYHWTQVFPTHATVHIRHEYSPVEGFQMLPRDAFRQILHQPNSSKIVASEKASAEDQNALNAFCAETDLLRTVERSIEAQGPDDSYAHVHWVDFVLTSANTWKRPIEDFTLIVERGAMLSGEVKTLVSFCTPERSPVQKVDTDHFQVHLTNFIPKSELHIGFFDLPARKSTSALKTAK